MDADVELLADFAKAGVSNDKLTELAEAMWHRRQSALFRTGIEDWLGSYCLLGTDYPTVRHWRVGGPEKSRYDVRIGTIDQCWEHGCPGWRPHA
jgi:hypothetical protein